MRLQNVRIIFAQDTQGTLPCPAGGSRPEFPQEANTEEQRQQEEEKTCPDLAYAASWAG